jgi:hypothetical protein
VGWPAGRRVSKQMLGRFLMCARFYLRQCGYRAIKLPWMLAGLSTALASAAKSGRWLLLRWHRLLRPFRGSMRKVRSHPLRNPWLRVEREVALAAAARETGFEADPQSIIAARLGALTLAAWSCPARRPRRSGAALGADRAAQGASGIARAGREAGAGRAACRIWWRLAERVAQSVGRLQRNRRGIFETDPD